MLKYTSVSLLLMPVLLGQANLTTAQIAKRLAPSVVTIQGKTDTGDVLGSGFIISKDGKIVTNLHVIRGLKSANVQLANGELLTPFPSLPRMNVVTLRSFKSLASISLLWISETPIP